MMGLRAALRAFAAGAMLATAAACDQQAPSAPGPLQTPQTNQAPRISAGAVSPSLGIDDVTTFTVRVEVQDPDADQVSLKVSGCSLGQDAPVALQNGAATVSFRSSWGCGTSIRLVATDARGASAEKSAPFQRFSMRGAFRFVIGEGIYTQPAFGAVLTQSGSLITGTIHDFRGHRGATDPNEPGTIDAEGRFRIRFKIESEGDLVVTGQVTSTITTIFDYVLVGRGTVLGDLHTGRAFQVWHEAMY